MDFASRVSLTCFVASYGISLVNEVLRLIWPHRWVRWLATSGAVAGFTAQTLFLAHRWYDAGRPPIATQFDSLVTISWLVGLIYLYLLLRDRRLAAGIFLLPIMLALLGFAATLPHVAQDSAAELRAGTRLVLLTHGLLFLVGTVLVLNALVTALMYLVKVHQLKAGTPLANPRLPSLERLDRIHSISVWVAWICLTLGLALGFLPTPRLAWSDPKIWVTLLAWLVFTGLAHYRFEHRGQRVALLTVVACCAILLSVLGDPLFGTGHQTRPAENLPPPAREAEA